VHFNSRSDDDAGQVIFQHSILSPRAPRPVVFCVLCVLFSFWFFV
jgi:hypothetical protein